MLKYAHRIPAMLVALAVGSGGAQAFTTQTVNTNVQTKANARLADPDDLMDSMASQQSSGTVGAMRFGGATLRFEGPSSGGDGPNSPFLADPAARTVPSLQGR